jgi:SAM-dependent methyltransferase
MPPDRPEPPPDRPEPPPDRPEPPPDRPEPPPDRPEPPPDQPAPTAAGFDAAFSAVPASAGLKRAWQLAVPELPPEIEPFSFVSLGLLRHVAHALNLTPGQTLVDLGCGRGGPGLWLARTTNASLVGVDFSPVAVEQAAQRVALFGLAGRARFVIGDLTHTGLPGHSADAAVSVDAFHFAADPDAAATHAHQLLRPGARLVLTTWQPKHPGDRRLPTRARIDWPPLLRAAGFADINMAERPGWHALWTRVYQVALDLGDPGDDTALADLQDEARRRLPLAGLSRRVVVTATSGRRPKPKVTTGKLQPRRAAGALAWSGPGGTG